MTAGAIPDFLESRAKQGRDRVFVTTGSKHVTYGEMESLAAQVAMGLAGMGIRPGDRIAIAALNGLEWLGLFFGAALLGAPVVTLNPRYRERELDYMLNQSGAPMVVCQARAGEFDFVEFLEKFRPKIPTVEHFVFIGGEGFSASMTFDELVEARAGEMGSGQAFQEQRSMAAREPHRPAAILYTLGTTGQPKGAVLTHKSMLASAKAQASHLGWDEQTSVIMALPLNHVGGITCGVLSVLVAGGQLVMLPAFSPAEMMAQAGLYRPNVIAGVPTMYVMPLEAWRQEPRDTSWRDRRAAGERGLRGGSILADARDDCRVLRRGWVAFNWRRS